MDHAIINAPFGQLRLAAEADCLIEIEFLLDRQQGIAPISPILKKTHQQLAAYFKNPDHVFEVPMKLHGTDFQQRVWQALYEIPPGKPWTYGQLAKKLATAPRAVGGACGANPIPIIVPCHRVVSVNGHGGFMHSRADAPLSIKQWLLAHERGQ